MNKKRLLLIVLIIVIVGGYFGYNYAYKDHRDIETETSAVTGSATSMEQFFLNEKGSEILNKTITVTGAVTQVEENSITIDDKVQCSFTTPQSAIKKGDEITVKGRCIGYDDLFELVKMDQCSLTKN